MRSKETQPLVLLLKKKRPDKNVHKLLIRKIKSERGATLSMAILLFMVCAVVGGIILAAATTATGRFSQMAESDQKYYSVMSAAQLLIDKINKKEVKIERTWTYQVDVDAFDNEDTNSINSANEKYEMKINNTAFGSTSTLSFLSGAAMYLLFGEDPGLSEKTATQIKDYLKENWNDSVSTNIRSATSAGSPFNIFVNNDQVKDATSVICTPGFSSGEMSIHIASSDGGTNAYSVNLALSLEYKEDESEQEVELTKRDEDGRCTVEKTITKTSTISWKLSELSK